MRLFQATSDSVDLAGFVRRDVDWAFEQFSFVEHSAGADQGDHMWRVHGTPAGLCGVDELVGHRNSGRLGAGALGDFRSQTYCGEGAFDRVDGPQMHPVLGRVLVELQEDVGVFDDFGDGFRVLGAVVDLEGLDRELGLD